MSPMLLNTLTQRLETLQRYCGGKPHLEKSVGPLLTLWIGQFCIALNFPAFAHV